MYSTKLKSLHTPGVLTTNAGYVYSTAKWGFHSRVYGYWGPKTRPLGLHTYQGSWSEASLDYSSYHNTVTSWINGSVLSPNAFGMQISPDSVIPYAPLYERLLDKLNDQTRGNVDLSIDLAQAGQTRRMFSATTQAEMLCKLVFTRAPQGFKRGFYENLRNYGSLWLQWVYGISPLIGTIYGAGTEMQRMVFNSLNRYQARVSEQRTKADISFYLYYGGYSGYLKCNGSYRRSLNAGVFLEPRGFSLGNWTSLNPASIAWELVPYSFVVDWFLGVGNYLRNFETALLNQSSFRGGYITDVQALDMAVADSTHDPNGWTESYSGSVRHRSVYRDVLNSYPVPRLPTFKADLGSSRLLSAASLLAQHLPRR